MLELIFAFYLLAILAGLFLVSGLLVWMIYPDTAKDFMEDWDQS